MNAKTSKQPPKTIFLALIYILMVILSVNTISSKSCLAQDQEVGGQNSSKSLRQHENLPGVPNGSFQRYSEDESSIHDLFSKNDYASIEGFYRDLFSEADIDQLEKIKLHSNPSVSVQSAWEILRVRQSSDYERRSDTRGEGFFLGYLEGKFSVSIPDWWENHVRSDIRNEISEFPVLQRTHAGELLCPLEVSVVDSGKGRAVLRHGNRALTVPEEILDRDDTGSLGGNIAVLFSGDRCFIARYDETGLRVNVFCVDVATGRTIWSSPTPGSYPSNMLFSGPRWAYGSLALSRDDRLSLFFGGTFGYFVLVLNPVNGEPIAQFSTRYRAD